MLRALLMAFGMFSIFPVPRNHWDDRALVWVVLFWPLVGGAIGGIWYLSALATGMLPLLIQTLLVAAVPFVLSGFLHVDGYMDTADGVFSRRELAEKRKILKDSHVGAFAVIALCGLLFVHFAAAQTILQEKKAILAFLFIPMISRCLVGLMLLTLKPMSETGMMAMFRDKTGFYQKAGLAMLGIAVMCAAVIFGGVATLAPLAAVTIGTLATGWSIYGQFQGFSGDLCGCSLVVGEMCGVLAMAVA